ncbi:ABC transporter protein EcsB [Marininema mesophilum]|uniref:ABC transporter protein EcsB n=1 Tax=Marininema mesophilum TaxID=1048340 RepID=A0A1H2ZZ11_9BACL|nr:ABC transporter permease [Marininema mesophilum]SDX22626.1 ABC transporter protein EcsB [Marininema mesophilum]
MSPARCYRKRRKLERIYNFRTWKTVIDWVVAVYFIVPAVVIFGERYISWLKDAPHWFSNFSPWHFLAGFYLLASMRKLRLQIEEADQLFIIQQKDWLKRFITCALLHQILRELWTVIVIFLVMFPVLVKEFHLDSLLLLSLLLYCWLARVSLVFAGNLIYTRVRSWKKHLYEISYFLVSGSLFVIVGTWGLKNPWILCFTCIVLACALYIQVHSRIAQRGTFLIDIEIEKEERSKWNKFLLEVGQQIDPPSGGARKKPWIFPQSGRIFPKRTGTNIVTENVFKALMRNRQMLLEFGQLVGVSLFALIQVPMWMGWCLWVVFAIIFTFWGRMFWKKVSTSPFFSTWISDTALFISAYERFLFLAVCLGYLPLSIFFGAMHYGWMGALGMPILGGVIGRIMASIFTLVQPLSRVRRKERVTDKVDYS